MVQIKQISHVVVLKIMLRIAKIPYFYSLLLLLICITSSFSSVQGWCIESRGENIDTHIELSDCHSVFSACDDTTPSDVPPAHATDKNGCTSCFDIETDIIAAKLVNDSCGSLVAPPPSNGIIAPQQYSELKSFATASPGDGMAFDQSSLPQTPQNKAIRTVVLLI
jgi:hypothetical protein